MFNYKLVIAYDGSRYNGWQLLKTTDMTIQGKLNEVLSKMAGTTVEVQGAGRTDAGVHARGQVANVKFATAFLPEEIRDYCNHYLPRDIAVMSVTEVAERFHSRLSATSKIYEYRIHNGCIPDVFGRKYVCHMEGTPLNVDAMKEAAKNLCGTHDYASFCGNKKMKKSTVRTVYSIAIIEDDSEVRISYHGDGFLQYMVRILTGTLVEVGEGKRRPDEMEKLLEAKDRQQAGRTMPPEGLSMVEVFYEK